MTPADRIRPVDDHVNKAVHGSDPRAGEPLSLRHRKSRVALLFRRHIDALTRVATTLDLRRPMIYNSLQCPPPLELALDTLVHLASMQEMLTSHSTGVVAVARASGATWTQIGDASGISEQAAHERFRGPLESVPDRPER